MIKLLVLSAFLLANSAQAQPLSKGKQRLREAMEFQSALSKGSTSLVDVRDEWTRASRDPEVRKDKDALAIAYGSRAIVERDLNEMKSADSLFALAMPLFELKASKAYFLVTYATLKRDNQDKAGALTLFSEIASDFDSLPQLNGIDFYRKSGYAELAYGIDAARNIALIGYGNEKLRPRAVAALKTVYQKHPNDQLGLMALTGLVKIDEANRKKHLATQAKFVEKHPSMKQLSTDFATELR